jgi:hypothetical protein
MSDLYDVDPNFARDLLLSEWPVYKVASFFRRNGFTVTLPPIVVRPHGAPLKAYSDTYDLKAMCDGSSLLIEVKRRNITFTSLRTFPFPTVIIDAASHYDTLSPKPDFHFLLNKGCSIALVAVPGQWEKRRIHSDARGRERDYYLAPKSSLFEIEL